jgi:hypothetical protein
MTDYHKPKLPVKVGDLVKWRYWQSDIFEGPEPIGIVIKIHTFYAPPFAEVLYVTGKIQYESIDALELVSSGSTK